MPYSVLVYTVELNAPRPVPLVPRGADGEWNHSHQGRGQFTVHRTQCVHADVLRRTEPYLLRFRDTPAGVPSQMLKS